MTQKKNKKPNPLKQAWRLFVRWWRAKLWHKFFTVFLILIALSLGTMYGIARWYIYEESNQPYDLGTTFISGYAAYLGLDPHQTLNAILTDLKISNIRLVSYWNEIEPTPGHYDFSELDYEFQQASLHKVPVTLAIGLRQPRWPECHLPDWAQNQPSTVWIPELKTFMAAVVNRYKNNPDLASYQLENEYFLKAFGTCTNYSRARLVSEYNLVKQLDPKHTIIDSRSNNAIGLPLGAPRPDEFGISVYKRVWDKTITHRYFEYPIPAWYYGFLAGATKIVTGRNMIIHELQAEPWPPTDMVSASEAEQDKSMTPAILKSRFEYGEATGMKTIDMWGSEWWYYQMIIKHNPGDWKVAEQMYQQAYNHNQALLKK
jgi:hypothetical protein